MVVINPVKNMFWGVALDAGKRYSQVVDQTFHLSMAALEPGSATGNEYVQVMLQRESSEFLLCSLQQGKIMQQPLDLIFSAGEELSFSLGGKGTVHLTGYVIEDEPGMEDDYSDEESDAPELVEMDSDLLKPGSKRKAFENALQFKKKKLSESIEDDDDEEDDEDFEGDDDDDDDDDDSGDDSDESDESFSEDELTFDEDEGSDLLEDDEEDDKNLSPKKAAVVTPKGGNLGTTKKDKNTPKTPSSVQKINNQKKNDKTPQTPTSQKKNLKQEEKSPQTPNTPNTPANGESAKKKKKNKKNKDGNSSMNQSTNSTPSKSSPESTPKSAKKGKESNTPKIVTPGKKKVVAGGTVVEDVKVGHGPEAKPGKMVSVYYVGTLTANNKRFDSCTGGKPFRFRLKQGEVIKGWDNGVEGMKVGGKRKIVVPPNQGYGGQKQGPIPPNSSLTFEVELKAVS